MNPNQRGAQNFSWKGNAVSYKGAHTRIQRLKGRPKICEHCGRKDGWLEWANVSRRYYDMNDYIGLCRSCHCAFDRKNRKLTEEQLNSIPKLRAKGLSNGDIAKRFGVVTSTISWYTRGARKGYEHLKVLKGENPQ
jgi:hypothetical protein